LLRWDVQKAVLTFRYFFAANWTHYKDQGLIDADWTHYKDEGLIDADWTHYKDEGLIDEN